MNLNEKIAARRRERQGSAENIPSTRINKKIPRSAKQVHMIYSTYLWQAAADSLEKQSKELLEINSEDLYALHLKEEAKSLRWNIELKQKIYQKDFKNTEEIEAAQSLLNSSLGKNELASFIKRAESSALEKTNKNTEPLSLENSIKEASPLTSSNSSSEVSTPVFPFILLAGLIYIFYLFIFDPDFSWKKFLLYFIGIVFVAGTFSPNRKT